MWHATLCRDKVIAVKTIDSYYVTLKSLSCRMHSIDLRGIEFDVNQVNVSLDVQHISLSEVRDS